MSMSQTSLYLGTSNRFCSLLAYPPGDLPDAMQSFACSRSQRELQQSRVAAAAQICYQSVGLLRILANMHARNRTSKGLATQ